ncbi:hypothetical protein ABIW67_004073 [Escherichia coli]|uniref:Uncharacterized protein n=1 Tax=Escherichia coli TaxID=562 RepID=A0AAP1WAL6_ECOLX|nr:hypothetical protein [Salmonella enterica]EFB2998312.1 hypothetical protein [Escherichia coli]EGW1594928.1 hypothetical protein [Salmonella enterica subsp. enterica serovar Bareilly]EHR9471642.1 hypothetical protein [Shigella flexneri]WHR21088.1 hypothetical protein MO411_28170 [Klebsiella pneumoniae]HBH7606657.1 hypothetical protein [Shigella sonnei]HDL8799290.1 hypothetical protein [Yersinia enterocolitica]
MASATGSIDRNKKTERECPSNEGEKTEVQPNDRRKKARLVRSGLLLSGAVAVANALIAILELIRQFID